MSRPWIPLCLTLAALAGCNDHRYGFFGNEEGSGGETTTTGPDVTTVSPTTVSTITAPDPTSPDPSTSSTTDPSGPGTVTVTSMPTTMPTSSTVTTVTTDTTGTPGQCGEEPLPSAVPVSTETNNGGLPDLFFHDCVGEGGPDAVFVWTAPFDGVFQFDTFQSEIDTVLSVFDGYCGGPSLGCNDDTVQLWSAVQAKLAFGTTVTIAVDGLGGAVGPIRVNVDVIEEPPPPPPPPPPPECIPIDIGGSLGEFVVSTLTGTFALESGCGGGTSPETVLLWTPPFAGNFRVQTSGSNFDPMLSIRLSACDGPELVCNDDFMDLESRVDFFAEPAGGPLLIVLDGISGTAGDSVVGIFEN